MQAKVDELAASGVFIPVQSDMQGEWTEGLFSLEGRLMYVH
jgi:hypothetical protein